MIALEQVAARHPPLALANISWASGAGVHALVGASADGGPLLLALLAGVARPRSGRVRVLGGRPTDVAVRNQVAFIPRQPALPDAMSVTQVLDMAAVIRAEPLRDAAERLGTLGVQALASRAVGTLSRAETRAVAITEATTSQRVRVLLIDEPFVDLDPRCAANLPEVLRSRSQDGCAIVVTTASVRDAAEIAGDHVLLRGGAIVGQAASLDALAGFSPHGARLRIVASDPKMLASALAREEGVEAVARRGTAVIVRGQNTLEVARAAGRAILAAGVDVTEMRVQPPSLDDMRAAVAAVAATSRKRDP